MTEAYVVVVTPDGEIVLPRALLDRKGWGGGTQLQLDELPDGLHLTQTQDFPPTEIDAVFGSLKRDEVSLTVQEMDQAVAKEAMRRSHE
jgi:hypothetical protein